MPGFAVLAPVPRVHMDSALEVLEKLDFALFGSDAFEFFLKTEVGAKVLFYVSHESSKSEAVVSYEGVYKGYESDPVKMRQLEKAGYRPSSTVNDGKWGGYWKVSGVKPLVQPIPLAQIQLASGGYLKGVPRGPLHVLG